MRQINTFTLPAGHTTTCVNDCDVLWTAGPAPTRSRTRGSTAGRSTRPTSPIRWTRSRAPSRSTPISTTARAATSTTSRSTRGAWPGSAGRAACAATGRQACPPVRHGSGHGLRPGPVRGRRLARGRDPVALHAQRLPPLAAELEQGEARMPQAAAASRRNARPARHRGEHRLGLRDLRALRRLRPARDLSRRGLQTRPPSTG